MTTHLTDERLLASLDGELPHEEARAVERHVAGCAECAARLETVRRRAAAARDALRALDVAPSWTEMPEGLRAAARRQRGRAATPPGPPDGAEPRGATVRPIGATRSRHDAAGRRRPIAVAAGFLLLVAAGASAIPGSPLRGWVADSAAAIAALFEGDGGVADDGPVAGAAGPDEAGAATVSVQPRDGRLVVAVRAPRPGARLTIRTVAHDRASASATSARYEVGPGRIEVLEPEGELLVSLPAGLREAVVEVDGRRVAELREGALRRTGAADSPAAPIPVEIEG